MLRFIHITDTHIGPTSDFSLYGRQPLPWLKRLVDEINALPFAFDFVLHNGDVSDDGSAESYALAKTELDRLRVPIKYVVGNHDDGAPLQTALLDSAAPPKQLCYTFDVADVRFVVLDSNGTVTPGGEIGTAQLAWLDERLGETDTPAVVVLHHHPVALDCPWLDFRGDDWPENSRMDMPDRARLLAALAPYAPRLRGVFFGHVHHAFTVTRAGILFSAAPSAFCQLRSWPTDRTVVPDLAPPSYSVVTITDDGQTIVRHLTLAMK